MKHPIKPSRDRSRWKYISKYFKQYFHFKNYGGNIKTYPILRRAISTKTIKKWNKYIVSLIEQVPEEAVSKNLLEIYK